MKEVFSKIKKYGKGIMGFVSFFAGVPAIYAFYGDAIGEYLCDRLDIFCQTEYLDICKRTEEVQIAIMRVTKAENCAAVVSEKMEEIRQLKIKQKCLTTLKAGDFDSLPNLEGLDLRENKLKELKPNVFKGLLNLEKINLRDNKLKELGPKVFADLPKLKSLDLRDNKLKKLWPDDFAKLPKLEILNLSDNSIHQAPPEVFADLHRLERLQLRQNLLTQKECQSLKDKYGKKVVRC